MSVVKLAGQCSNEGGTYIQPSRWGANPATSPANGMPIIDRVKLGRESVEASSLTRFAEGTPVYGIKVK